MVAAVIQSPAKAPIVSWVCEIGITRWREVRPTLGLMPHVAVFEAGESFYRQQTPITCSGRNHTMDPEVYASIC